MADAVDASDASDAVFRRTAVTTRLMYDLKLDAIPALDPNLSPIWTHIAGITVYGSLHDAAI